MARSPAPNRDVFLNCPFDDGYREMRNAIGFAVLALGFNIRSALEADNSGQTRIDKILSIIKACQYGIHDISCVELDGQNNLPRFNMPFELGLFIGAMKFGGAKQKGKSCVILDAERYRYQKFLSDIGGQDIKSHDNKPEIAVRKIRAWFASQDGVGQIMGESRLHHLHTSFMTALPNALRELGLSDDEMTFNEFSRITRRWLGEFDAR